MLELASLKLDRLESVNYRSKWIEGYTTAGIAPPRRVYKDADYFYKIWDERYFEHRRIVHKGRLIEVDNRGPDGREVLLGYLFGLYNEKICPAFAGHIYDGERLAGYRTLAAPPPSDTRHWARAARSSSTTSSRPRSSRASRIRIQRRRTSRCYPMGVSR